MWRILLFINRRYCRINAPSAFCGPRCHPSLVNARQGSPCGHVSAFPVAADPKTTNHTQFHSGFAGASRREGVNASRKTRAASCRFWLDVAIQQNQPFAHLILISTRTTVGARGGGRPSPGSISHPISLASGASGTACTLECILWFSVDCLAGDEAVFTVFLTDIPKSNSLAKRGGRCRILGLTFPRLLTCCRKSARIPLFV